MIKSAKKIKKNKKETVDDKRKEIIKKYAPFPVIAVFALSFVVLMIQETTTEVGMPSPELGIGILKMAVVFITVYMGALLTYFFLMK